MNSETQTININGVEYVEKSSVLLAKAQDLEGMPYVLIRADRAGVFVGYLESKEKDTVVIRECRRLWYWDGASSISEIAVYGVSKPENCKFPIAVNKAEISGVIEILEVTEDAKKNISLVPVWTQK